MFPLNLFSERWLLMNYFVIKFDFSYFGRRAENFNWLRAYSDLFWSECGTIRTRKTPSTDTFHAVMAGSLSLALLRKLRQEFFLGNFVNIQGWSPNFDSNVRLNCFNSLILEAKFRKNPLHNNHFSTSVISNLWVTDIVLSHRSEKSYVQNRVTR